MKFFPHLASRTTMFNIYLLSLWFLSLLSLSFSDCCTPVFTLLIMSSWALTFVYVLLTPKWLSVLPTLPLNHRLFNKLLITFLWMSNNYLKLIITIKNNGRCLYNTKYQALLSPDELFSQTYFYYLPHISKGSILPSSFLN